MNVEVNHSADSIQCKRCDYIRELLTWSASTESKSNNISKNDTDDLHLHAELDTMGLVVGLNIK